MGGQTGSQQEQTQQVTQLPPWINEAAQQNYGFAQNIASRPLQQYQGQMVPDTAPQLQQAWNTAATSGNAGIPQYNAATAGYMGALGQTPMNVTPQTLADVSKATQYSPVATGGAGATGLEAMNYGMPMSNSGLGAYMNPYTQSVINSSLPIMQQELGKTLAANAGTAAQQNAFGGSRFGVQQGTAQAQGALGMANMAAGLNQANFAQAQAAATGDIQRNLAAQQSNQTAQQAKINSDIAASQGLNTTAAGLGTQANQAYTMQNQAGAEQMAQAQSQINAQMQKFQQAWGYPTQQLGVLQSALGQTPYGQASTGEKDTQTQLPMDWGALAGQGLGLLNSFIPKPSDKRLKKNLQKLGVHPPTGTPIYAFNWKGEPPGAPKSLGPMAQDLAKTVPGSVAPHPATGVLQVHPAVHGALSRPAPAGTIGAMIAGGVTPMSRTQHRRRIRPPQISGALAGG